MSCDIGKAYSPTFPSLHQRHSSFSNPSVASPTSQLILQPFRRFTNIIADSSILPSLHLCHSSFSNPSVASPTSQPILQPFRRFTYVTAHSPTFPSLYLRHRSFSNAFVAVTSSTSQLILQSFFRFSYVTGSSLTSPGEPPNVCTLNFCAIFVFYMRFIQINYDYQGSFQFCSLFVCTGMT